MEEDELGAIGFLFDAFHEKAIFTIVLKQGIEIKVKTIGDSPGHKQSGQYLWPAAEIAANYFIDNWNNIHATRVLELGAGCGLAGLAIAHLPGVKEVVFTDYDYGTLNLIKESVQLNGSSIDPGKATVDFLEWGNFEFEPDKRITTSEWNTQRYSLVVGTDLIYSKDVVLPLFRTVDFFLKEDGIFILTSSFPLGLVGHHCNLTILRMF